MKIRRPRHRCPKCRSNNVYRRTLSPMYTQKSKKKGRHKIIEEIYGNSSKKYRCIACKNEFNIALIE